MNRDVAPNAPLSAFLRSYGELSGLDNSAGYELGARFF
jgi:hypothetical protein